MAGYGRDGPARQGVAWCGLVRQSEAGKAWHGWLGSVRPGRQGPPVPLNRGRMVINHRSHDFILPEAG
jgi:hypothetical protein